MNSRDAIVRITLMLVALLAGATPATAEDEKPKTGTIIGKVKGQRNTVDGKNTIIEVLAPGEEKPRGYHVMFDPKIKGPVQSVLTAVRASNVDDTVEFEWIQTGHGPAITSFKVVKKATGGDKKE